MCPQLHPWLLQLLQQLPLQRQLLGATVPSLHRDMGGKSGSEKKHRSAPTLDVSAQGRIGTAGIENQGELMGILRDTGAIGVPPCLLAKDNLVQASAEQQVLQPCRSASKKLTNPVA